MGINAAEIAGILKKSDNIIIAGHTSPDGDAVGACMAMALSLRELGKEPRILLEDYSKKYSFIPGKEFLYRAEGGFDNVEADVFLALDCADKERLGMFKEVFDRSKTKVCVDHHSSNEGYGDYNLIIPDISSTSEIVYEIAVELGTMNSDIAAAVYAGIVFDTGGFRHKSTGAGTHAVTSRLLSYDIDFSGIYNHLMTEHTLMEARCFGFAVSNMVCLLDEGIGFTSISAEQRDSLGVTVKDYSGIVEYVLNTKGIEVAFFVYEKANGEIKVSFRSKGIDVAEIASKYGGGGHRLAAGCSVEGDINKVTDTILKELREGINDL